MVALWIFIICISFCKAEIPEEDGVLVLSQANFEEAIRMHDYILVEFYAPWCGHCKALAPKYVEAAKKLKEEGSPIKLAKLDATVETEIATKYGVRGYPTIKYFKKQMVIEFNGQRETDEIISWCKRKMLPSVQKIENIKQFKDFRASAKHTVVAFVKDDDDKLFENLEKYANELDMAFAITSNSDVLSENKITKSKSIVLFKPDGDFVEFPEDSIEKLSTFIRVEMVPLITEFTQETASIVFSSPIQKHVMVFTAKDDNYEKLLKELKDVALAFKGRMHVIVIDTKVDEHVQIMNFFNLVASEAPTYRVVELSEQVIKYKPPSSELTASSIISFGNDVLNKKVKPFLRSEEIPPESTDGVRVLVGYNYYDVCLDDSKIVAVKIYAPWCGHCKALAPIWDKIGEAYKNSNEVIIAKMDATANEVENLKISGYPTILLYTKTSKEPITYIGDRTYEAIVKFIDSEGKINVGEKEESELKDEL